MLPFVVDGAPNQPVLMHEPPAKKVQFAIEIPPSLPPGLDSSCNAACVSAADVLVFINIEFLGLLCTTKNSTARKMSIETNFMQIAIKKEETLILKVYSTTCSDPSTIIMYSEIVGFERISVLNK